MSKFAQAEVEGTQMGRDNSHRRESLMSRRNEITRRGEVETLATEEATKDWRGGGGHSNFDHVLKSVRTLVASIAMFCLLFGCIRNTHLLRCLQ